MICFSFNHQFLFLWTFLIFSHQDEANNLKNVTFVIVRLLVHTALAYTYFPTHRLTSFHMNVRSFVVSKVKHHPNPPTALINTIYFLKADLSLLFYSWEHLARCNCKTFPAVFGFISMFPVLIVSSSPGSAKRRRKQDQCCGHLNSLSAIKYAIVSLYILVLLTIFGLCLAGRMCVSGLMSELDYVAAVAQEILNHKLLPKASKASVNAMSSLTILKHFMIPTGNFGACGQEKLFYHFFKL